MKVKCKECGAEVEYFPEEICGIPLRDTPQCERGFKKCGVRHEWECDYFYSCKYLKNGGRVV